MASYNGTKLLNGNISETYWRSNSDNVIRKYGYSYDAMNRLLAAVYQKPNSNVPVTNMYNETLSYDKNGNIQTLQRNGDFDSDDVSASAVEIDNLVYTYDDEKPNQLKEVTDSSNLSLGFKDDNLPDNETDYHYDSNGNLKTDVNKGIEKIDYNHLNLPTVIRFSNGGIISYLYNAAGQKAQKTVTTATATIMTDYLNGFQYVNHALNFFPHAEGFVDVKGTNAEGYKYFFVYNYTDHSGNIRVSFGFDPDTRTLKTLEENHYYPFGLKHTNYNTYKQGFKKEDSPNDAPPTSIPGLVEFSIKQVVPGELLVYKYKYNGKEWQDELGLNMYDFGARNYDPAIGRWMNIDPLAENSRRWTPYNNAYNNPMYFIDPDGMQAGAASDLDNSDFDTMVDVGYGKMVNQKHLTGKVDFSGGEQVLNKKGEEKVNAVIDAFNDNLFDSSKVTKKNDSTDPTDKNKEYIAYLRFMLAEWKTSLAVFAITKQRRHLLGPDAIYASGTSNISPLIAGFSGSVGYIQILYGANSGHIQPIQSEGFGLMSPNISLTGDLTKLYYSGNIKDFNSSGFRAFYGPGAEISAGISYYGLTASAGFSYANSTNNNFVVGVTRSFGTWTPGVGGSIIKTETKKW